MDLVDRLKRYPLALNFSDPDYTAPNEFWMLGKDVRDAAHEIERLREKERKLGVHLSHCNFGEYEGVCKYGDEDCPALSDSWSWFGNYIKDMDRLKERISGSTGPFTVNIDGVEYVPK